MRAKKSLGQNFLIDPDVIKTILKCSSIKNKEILEVGPGTGNLTEKIVENKPSKIFLIEKLTGVPQVHIEERKNFVLMHTVI